jgi:hypothetical protein
MRPPPPDIDWETRYEPPHSLWTEVIDVFWIAFTGHVRGKNKDDRCD